MSPKTATISLALISLALTLTPSSAQSTCGTKTVAELLKKNNLPPGLFPNNVKHFSCIAFGPYPIVNVVLSIQLEDACKVTGVQTGGLVTDFEYKPMIRAFISDRSLTNVDGLILKFTAKSPTIGPLDLHMTVSEVRVFPSRPFDFIQFFSDSGVNSPPFPVTLLPSSPPSCDPKPSSDDVLAKLLPFNSLPELIN